MTFTVFSKTNPRVSYTNDYIKARELFDKYPKGEAALYPKHLPSSHTPVEGDMKDHVFVELASREELKTRYPHAKITTLIFDENDNA